MAKLIIKWAQGFVLALALVFSTGSVVAQEYTEYKEEIRPGYGRAVADVLLVRPFTFAAMLLGSAVFVVSSPVTAATGTIGEAGLTLVVEPALTTFARCLGCTHHGWRNFPSE